MFERIATADCLLFLPAEIVAHIRESELNRLSKAPGSSSALVKRWVDRMEGWMADKAELLHHNISKTNSTKKRFFFKAVTHQTRIHSFSFIHSYSFIICAFIHFFELLFLLWVLSHTTRTRLARLLYWYNIAALLRWPFLTQPGVCYMPRNEISFPQPVMFVPVLRLVMVKRGLSSCTCSTPSAFRTCRIHHLESTQNCFKWFDMNSPKNSPRNVEDGVGLLLRSCSN